VATQRDRRRIALSLPGSSEDPDEFRFHVDGKMFVWLWPERVAPKRARVPNPDVIVVRVAGDIDKQVLLAMDPKVSSRNRTTTAIPRSLYASRSSTSTY